MLLFLSKGYFSSRNCLLEVVSTLEKRKRIVLVHEADQSKGGQPLKDQKLELANACVRKLALDCNNATLNLFPFVGFLRDLEGGKAKKMNLLDAA